MFPPIHLCYKMMFMAIFFLALSLQPQAIRTHPSEGPKHGPFAFLRKLAGCHEGQTVNGLHGLKQYLHKFGYLANNTTHFADDYFDDILKSAIKTYQLNYHLEGTGVIDDRTVEEMIQPRCGVADIINGTSSMHFGGKHSHHHTLHAVASYTFFPGRPRWPPSKTHLTYGLIVNSMQGIVNIGEMRSLCARAFNRWADVSRFRFQEIQDFRSADIHIGFFRRDHGDSAPFDGRGGVLAHAFAPTRGWFHYDADESWAVNPSPRAFDLESVAVHEIGHLLGLGHSSEPGAIMFPSIPNGVRKVDLHDDDIQGIRALYSS